MRREALAKRIWVLMVVCALAGMVPVSHACKSTAAADHDHSSMHAHHGDSESSAQPCECGDCDCGSPCQFQASLVVQEAVGVLAGPLALNQPWKNRFHSPLDGDVVHPPPNPLTLS